MIPTPVLLAIVIAWGASLAGAGWYGIGLGEDRVTARQARDDEVRNQTFEDAQKGAAYAIARNRPINQTIVQKAETIVRENTVYRDCRHAPDGVRNINRALTGIDADVAGSGGMPDADAARR